MNSLAAKFERDARPKKDWSRILTNKMTIVAWRLYQGDRRIHFGLILYRLKRDFGFTEWELANFTGIPTWDISHYMQSIKPILDGEVLKILAKMDWEEDEHEWRSIPQRGGNTAQGYVIARQKPWYYKYDRLYKDPVVRAGGESEREYEEKLKNHVGSVKDSE